MPRDTMPSNTGLRPCPACAGHAFDPHLVVRGTPLVRCRGCGLITWNWAGFDFEAFYDSSYWRSPDVSKGYADYFTLVDAMVTTHRRRLAWISRHLAAGPMRSATAPRGPATLLDAGCGPGFFVQAATEAGFAAAGVELSEYAVTFARDELHQRVWQGQVRADDLRGGPYDVVTLWDVIEHLPDPRDALAALAGAMNRGGLLALSTGDVSSLVARLSGPRWHLYTLPEHLWFFTAGGLRRLLRRVGLEPVACRYEVCWYTVRYLAERIEAMAGRGRFISPRLGRASRLSVPVTLADIVTFLARKR